MGLFLKPYYIKKKERHSLWKRDGWFCRNNTWTTEYVVRACSNTAHNVTLFSVLELLCIAKHELLKLKQVFLNHL